MLGSVRSPTASIDQTVTARAWSHSYVFPVARTIGGSARDSHVHLVDGDGASLCEAVEKQHLEPLHIAWRDVATAARCRVCDALSL